MPEFGATSSSRLATLDLRLQQALLDAIKILDFTILCGHRSEAEQNECYRSGTSRVWYPNSQHNSMPSRAVDIAPWPIDWIDELAFARLAGVVQACAFLRGVDLRWGGDWDRDGSSSDQSFLDLCHLELADPPA